MTFSNFDSKKENKNNVSCGEIVVTEAMIETGDKLLHENGGREGFDFDLSSPELVKSIISAVLGSQ